MEKKLSNHQRLILQNLAEGVIAISLDRKIIFINDAAKRLLGITGEGPYEASCGDFISTDLCLNNCPINNLNNSCASHHININLYTEGNPPMPLCLNVAPLKDINGDNVGIIESFRPMSDVIEIIHALEKNNILISQEKNKIDSIVNSLADGVFTVDAGLCITSFNKGIERITGLKEENVIGIKCSDVLRADNCEKECPLSHALRNGYGIANKNC